MWLYNRNKNKDKKRTIEPWLTKVQQRSPLLSLKRPLPVPPFAFLYIKQKVDNNGFFYFIVKWLQKAFLKDIIIIAFRQNWSQTAHKVNILPGITFIQNFKLTAPVGILYLCWWLIPEDPFRQVSSTGNTLINPQGPLLLC